MKAPLTLEQIHPEGGTLAYLIRFHGHRILALGGMNNIEREIIGLEPDVALIGAGTSRKEIYDYCGRLMRDLHYPALVIPTHWDTFLAPYGASQQPALDALQSFLQEVAAASPKTKVIVPKYFEAIPLEIPAKCVPDVLGVASVRVVYLKRYGGRLYPDHGFVRHPPATRAAKCRRRRTARDLRPG